MIPPKPGDPSRAPVLLPGEVTPFGRYL